MNREPVLTRTAIAAVVTLAVTILGVFDVNVSDDTSAKVVDALYVLAPVLVWAWAAWSARNRVTPVEKEVAP